MRTIFNCRSGRAGSRITLAALLVIGTLLSVTQAGAAENAPAVDSVKKVVWHVDYGDPIRLGRMLTSVNNMLTTYEEMFADHDIRIVFLGAGIRFVTSDPLTKTPFEEDKILKQERKVLTERLQSAIGQGIKLELCKITATAVNLDEAKVTKGVALVPSGVVRIAELQSKGFAYLKAD
jgi:intracellular sulfur oxidation DsrE/DsrF family protein